jgi:hypothetical protein
MMAKRIEAIISEDGEVTLEVHGASGDECETMTADIENALGIVDPIVKAKIRSA